VVGVVIQPERHLLPGALADIGLQRIDDLVDAVRGGIEWNYHPFAVEGEAEVEELVQLAPQQVIVAFLIMRAEPAMETAAVIDERYLIAELHECARTFQRSRRV
jgi:hypothetical protein